MRRAASWRQARDRAGPDRTVFTGHRADRMVFSSHVFILGFLPLTLLAVMLSRHFAGRMGAVVTLVIASMAFYAWWDWRFLALLWSALPFHYYLSPPPPRPPPQGRRPLRLRPGIAAHLRLPGL